MIAAVLVDWKGRRSCLIAGGVSSILCCGTIFIMIQTVLTPKAEKSLTWAICALIFSAWFKVHRGAEKLRDP